MSATLQFADVSTLLHDLATRGVQVSDVTEDSRRVQPDALFIAFPGDFSDGRKYIGDAVARGAAAVIWQTGDDFRWQPEWHVPNFAVPAARPLCGPLAHAVYGYPSERLS